MKPCKTSKLLKLTAAENEDDKAEKDFVLKNNALFRIMQKILI